MPRILVIEDEESYRSVLVDSLAGAGYEVDSAENGVEGVALARQRLPDLVLCDIVMSELDGYGVLGALRRDAQTATIPVIFLTGLGGRTAFRRGMDSGADDYLEKPVPEDDLHRAIAARLARQAERRRDLQQRLAEVRAGLARSLPHEFLTPLTAVMGLSSFLMDDGTVDPDTAREIAQGIFLGSTQLQDLATKFLLYAELDTDTNGGGPPIASTAAPAVIRAAAEAKATRAGRPGDLRLSIDDVASPLSKDHLQSLVDELVENAFLCSSAGTPVTVQCRRDGSDWTFVVVDSGRGMSPEHLEALESRLPFSRRHEGQPGMGLGVAIVRRLARLYGGTLAFDTAPGRGTSAQVRLPAPG